MKTVHKTVLLWHSASDMFDLVTDVARYPQFLPWCTQASVVAQGETGMTAKLDIGVGGLKHSFTTLNTHIPGRRVNMELVDGPFSKLEGCWQFIPVGQAGENACKVDFKLHYAFSSKTVAALTGPVFDKIAASLVDAFVKRADEVYGV